MSRFRPAYRELQPDEKARVLDIKIAAEQLDKLLSVPWIPSSRELALARTKLEECVMWATKAITG